MRKLSGWSLAAVLSLCPLTSLAKDVEVPELGVRLTTLPDAATAPAVIAQSGGYEATMRLGPAALRIYRDDEQVPSGSDVAEPAYRAELDKKFDNGVESKDQGAPTAVGGHAAWTVVDTREEGPLTSYTCVTYLIVDQHVYRLLVSAAPAAVRPPEFDTMVRVVSGLKFEPVRRAKQEG
jgi:hypothetical protein